MRTSVLRLQAKNIILRGCSIVRRLRKGKKIKMFLRFAGLGDTLFVNTMAYHYWRERGEKVLVAGNYPSLFKGNPGVWILPISSADWVIRIGILLRECGVIHQMDFLGYQPEGKDIPMKPMERHILAELAHLTGINTTPSSPVLFLSQQEIDAVRPPEGDKPWIAMHSTGITEMTSNKNWYPESFAAVATELRQRYRIVQLGLSSDPAIDCDLDLRSQVGPREAAAVMSSCRFVICQVGYLMHAAAAVGTPAVVVYGGFEAPWESGYADNINLFTQLECSPCWIKEPCPINKICMRKITPEVVLDGVRQLEMRFESRSARIREL